MFGRKGSQEDPLLGKPASGERLKRALLELKYRPDRPSSLSD